MQVKLNWSQVKVTVKDEYTIHASIKGMAFIYYGHFFYPFKYYASNEQKQYILARLNSRASIILNKLLKISS